MGAFPFGVYPPRVIPISQDAGGQCRPEHIALRDIAKAFATELGIRRVYNVPMPQFLLNIGATVMSRVLKNPPITPAELSQLKVDNITTLDSVDSAFGFQPRHFADFVLYIRDVEP